MAIGAVASGAVRIGSMFARGTGSLLGRGGGMLHKATLKRSKIRRENFVRTRKLNKGLIETRRRREKESMLEASKLGRGSSSGIVKLPGSSFFGKVLNFIGILIVGWLVNNLPKIIEFVQNLITRIQKLVDSLKSFVKNLGDWFKSIGDIVSAGWSNIKNLDFTDSEGKLKAAMDNLDKAFKGMQTDVEGMKNALTADVNELKGTSDNTGETSGSSVTGTDAEKYKQFYDMAQKAGAKYPELVAAQFALESGYGSAISGSNNYFGLKATDSESGAMKGTTEFTGGVEGATTAKFMNFGSAQESVNTLVNRWYKDYGNYKGVNRASSAQDAAKQLQQQGYATDPNYASKLKRIMKQNASVVNQGGGSGGRYGGGGNVVEYITGDRGHPNFEYNGHGRESNYHDHIAFRTLQDKERAKTALRAAGIQVGSEYRPGDPGWHGANLAIDVPGAQWGGSGAIGQREFNGSAKVRQVLRDAGFGGGGLGHGRSMISRSTGRMPDIGYSTGPKNKLIIIEEEGPMPMMQQSSGKSSPVIVMGASLNSIMKRKLLTDLAYT
tara:strand:+ start:3344 stop:5002 length:1659 start_codon:yes stop_codon:yes gene_type:complete